MIQFVGYFSDQVIAMHVKIKEWMIWGTQLLVVLLMLGMVYGIQMNFDSWKLFSQMVSDVIC
jgi:hypothetical protein